MPRTSVRLTFAFLIVSALAHAAESPLPPATDKKVSFSREVLPILAHRCFECHAGAKKKGRLQLDSRESLLKGGETGPAAVLNKSAESLLIKRVAGHVDSDDEIMPPKAPRLTAAEIGLLRGWIDQGLEWDKVVREKTTSVPVALRPVTLPPGDGHPIDRLFAAYFTKNAVAVAPVEDRLFARRAYLDAIGLLPTPEQQAEFLADTRPDKRAQLVQKLLADSDAYTDHWITFWQDLLRDGKKDLGSTDVFRPITPWLVDALRANMPYDAFAAELVNPRGLDATLKNREADLKSSKNDDAGDKTVAHDATGFVIGLQAGLEIPRGDQQWPVQAVQNISQVFLGVQLKCATCHDSFIDHWEMKDAWGLASIYTDKPLEMVRCELPTGKTSEPRFIFPEVGTIDPKAPTAQRRTKLAELVTSPNNGRFARTVINRLWARLLGRGLVEPVDEMDREAFAPDVLEWLARDFIDNKYDIKRAIAQIMTSSAYQLPTLDDPKKNDKDYVFRGPQLRRMSAEQYVDAVYVLTGKKERVWKEMGGRLLETLGRPDRRTVVTQRDARTSTLQFMELFNGSDLHAMLYGEQPQSNKQAPKEMERDKLGAKDRPVMKTIVPPSYAPFTGLKGRELTEKVFAYALGRKPSDAEAAACTALLSETVNAKGPPVLGDLMWAMVMLPEFQLIR